MAIWKDDNNQLHDDMDGQALLLPSWPKGMVQLTDEQVSAIRNKASVTSLPILAQQELDYVTGPRGQIMRCLVAMIEIPPVWQQYVSSLRNIVNGTDTTSTTLPTRPPYVQGS